MIPRFSSGTHHRAEGRGREGGSRCMPLGPPPQYACQAGVFRPERHVRIAARLSNSLPGTVRLSTIATSFTIRAAQSGTGSLRGLFVELYHTYEIESTTTTFIDRIAARQHHRPLANHTFRWSVRVPRSTKHINNQLYINDWYICAIRPWPGCRLPGLNNTGRGAGGLHETQGAISPHP